MLRYVAEIPRWDPDAGGPAYVYMRVADHLATRIDAGDLPADARLPGERDLAAEYGIALGTARRAVEELRDRGLAITLPGKGTFVVRPDKRLYLTVAFRTSGLTRGDRNRPAFPRKRRRALHGRRLKRRGQPGRVRPRSP